MAQLMYQDRYSLRKLNFEDVPKFKKMKCMKMYQVC